MATINDVIKNVDRLDLMRVAMDTLVDHAADVLELNTIQIVKGTRKDGSTINPTYRDGHYALMKNEMNSLPGLGIPDLALTGDFLNAMVFEQVGIDEWKDESTDWKNDMLKTKYSGSSDIFGLSSKSREQLIGEYGFGDDLINNVRKVVRL
jgi:hypothetical protein